MGFGKSFEGKGEARVVPRACRLNGREDGAEYYLPHHCLLIHSDGSTSWPASSEEDDALLNDPVVAHLPGSVVELALRCRYAQDELSDARTELVVALGYVKADGSPQGESEKS